MTNDLNTPENIADDTLDDVNGGGVQKENTGFTAPGDVAGMVQKKGPDSFTAPGDVAGLKK